MLNTDKLQVKILAQLCLQWGIKKAVISPGSRNAPLILAFDRIPEIECFVIPDERCAAYFALGMAQQLGQPVAIICTSGTAALNYTPALAEAWHQNIPLIAITADRPTEWVGQLDGQTINQTGIFENFTAYQAQLPSEITVPAHEWQTKRMVNDGLRIAIEKQKPVHFNVPLREPLYNLIPETNINCNAYNIEPLVQNYTTQAININQYTKVLIVLGMQRPNPKITSIIGALALKKQVVIIAENISNVNCEGVFAASDAKLAAIFDQNNIAFLPDLVISFADMVLSKPLKTWLRKLSNIQKWVVTYQLQVPDVFQGISKIIPLNFETFAQVCLAKTIISNSKYFELWQKAYLKLENLHQQFSESAAWSDFKVIEKLSKAIPNNTIVHLSNSTPVRYSQFFEWNKGINFYSNRGTAGIDGCTSTVLGMANTTNSTVTLITGDVGFLYDSNALWNQYLKSNFKIILINNGGGNIFSLIPGPDATGLVEKYFKTHIGVNINQLCSAYNVNYFAANNISQLSETIQNLYNCNNTAVLEVFTNTEANIEVWKQYFNSLKDEVL